MTAYARAASSAASDDRDIPRRTLIDLARSDRDTGVPVRRPILLAESLGSLLLPR